MLKRDVERLDAKIITIAIEDPEFALVRIREGVLVVQLEISHIPSDVRQDCLQLMRLNNKARL